jgi:hypothetical protein
MPATASLLERMESVGADDASPVAMMVDGE